LPLNWGFRLVTFNGAGGTIAHVDVNHHYRVGKYGVDVGAIDGFADAALAIAGDIDVYIIGRIHVVPATKSPGTILNAQSAARRANGRTPEVTQVSSVLSHWITEYIHVFCPSGQRYELRPVIRLSG
jgi:hypothetical protein